VTAVCVVLQTDMTGVQLKNLEVKCAMDLSKRHATIKDLEMVRRIQSL